MPTIRIIQATSTGLTAIWNNVQSILIGNPLENGEGGFGQVFNCTNVNGTATPVPLVIKIFKRDVEGNDKRGYTTIRKLQERIRAKNSDLAQTGRSVTEIPGLYALPQFSFEGVIGTESVLGYAAHKLDLSVFSPFDDILQHQFSAFRRLDLNLKFQLALDLAECFSILREINYIHADINPQNLFVSLNDGHLVLIDYDSGVVVDKPQDAPTTWGKPDEWVAPEVSAQQLSKSSSGQSMVTVDLFTDTWSVAVGIHYFIFCRYPYFFLNVAGPKEIVDYTNKFHWPEADSRYSNFDQNQENCDVYAEFRKNFNAIDLAIRRAFEVTFTEGLTKRHQRASYTQWVQLLKPRVRPVPFVVGRLSPLSSSRPKQPQPPPKSPLPSPPVRAGISTNWKVAIGVAFIVLIILAVISPTKSTEPVLNARPTSISNVTVTVNNNDCWPQDFYLNNQLVATVPAKMSRDVTVPAGQYASRACAAGTSNCGSDTSVTWMPGAANQTLLPSTACVSQAVSAELAQADQQAREQQARDQQARDQRAQEQQAQEQQARDQQAQEQRARDQQAHEQQQAREQQAREQQAPLISFRIFNQNCLTGDVYLNDQRVAVVQPNAYYDIMVHAGTYSTRACNPNTSDCTDTRTITIGGQSNQMTLLRFPSCNSGSPFEANFPTQPWPVPRRGSR